MKVWNTKFPNKEEILIARELVAREFADSKGYSWAQIQDLSLTDLFELVEEIKNRDKK